MFTASLNRLPSVVHWINLNELHELRYFASNHSVLILDFLVRRNEGVYEMIMKLENITFVRETK